jgi:hypothetical protein
MRRLGALNQERGTARKHQSDRFSRGFCYTYPGGSSNVVGENFVVGPIEMNYFYPDGRINSSTNQ